MSNSDSLNPEAQGGPGPVLGPSSVSDADAPRALPPWPVRAALAVAAVGALALGVIGLFVPGLPSTVFVLIAAWCAARSSPRLHAWLLAHRLFGPVIRDWQNGGRVSRGAKRAATVAMAFCALILAITTAPRWAAIGITTMAIVLTWLWRRPEP